ncbi:MAG: RNase H family protein [Deltaproteobacteria bacterium]|nr:RNase H family protein [Deltaproteobacteria bacterium]
MPWQKMRFKDQTVWVNTDDSGKPVVDAEGRAEMKYRENDVKSYRPAAVNLKAPGANDPPPDNRTRKKASTGATATKAAPKATATSYLAGKPLAGAIAIWTDGACTGNPGPMGIGMVVITPGKRIERGEYLGLGTNNIAELTAISRGVEMAMKLGVDPQAPMAVHTDSSYCIGVLSQGWKAKANAELIGEIREMLRHHPNLRFVKVEGHAGIPENERCDELARNAVKQRANV